MISRPNAWNRLGTPLPDTFTTAEALERSGLAGWNIRKMPLSAEVSPGKRLEIPGSFALVRDLPKKGAYGTLGTTGAAYKVHQNEELETLVDSLVDEAGASFESAGSIDNGTKVFVTVKLPGGLKVGGTDRVDIHLTAITSHDGSLSSQVIVSPERVASSTLLNLKFGGMENSIRTKKLSQDRPAEQALDFAFDYLDAFQKEANQLASTRLEMVRFEKLISREFGAPAGAPNPTVTRTENKLDHIATIFAGLYETGGMGETAWSGLVSLCEWYDHASHVRGAKPGEVTEDDLRARRAILDPWFKDQALDLMRSA